VQTNQDRKCTEPNFNNISKRTTLSTGIILECLATKFFKKLRLKFRAKKTKSAHNTPTV